MPNVVVPRFSSSPDGIAPISFTNAWGDTSAVGYQSGEPAAIVGGEGMPSRSWARGSSVTRSMGSLSCGRNQGILSKSATQPKSSLPPNRSQSPILDRRLERNTSGLARKECESAWNKDPVFGVIGIQSGPPGRWVHSGFRGGYGGQVGDAGSGDDREDPSGVFRPEQADQDDLPRVSGVAKGRAQGDPVAGDRVSL